MAALKNARWSISFPQAKTISGPFWRATFSLEDNMARFIIFATFFLFLNVAIMYLMSKRQRNRGSEHGQSGPGPDIG